MDSLASNPRGSSIYNDPGIQTPQYGQTLDLVNQLKDRELRDFKDKANFMSDLSLKQDRLRSLFNPEQQQPMNTVIGHDPSQMTGYEKGELGIKQQQLGQESQRISQQGKLGEESINVRQQQEKLNQQKSDQINANKQADMQRKIDESEQKIQLAQQALNSRNTNAEAQLQAHKDLAAAMEERHKLELAQKDAQFQKVSDQHQQTIDALQAKLKQGAKTQTTTEINPEGNRKTVTTQRGSSSMIKVQGKDGQTYEIPEDKLDDKDADGTPHWKKIGEYQ